MEYRSTRLPDGHGHNPPTHPLSGRKSQNSRRFTRKENIRMENQVKLDWTKYIRHDGQTDVWKIATIDRYTANLHTFLKILPFITLLNTPLPLSPNALMPINQVNGISLSPRHRPQPPRGGGNRAAVNIVQCKISDEDWNIHFLISSNQGATHCSPEPKRAISGICKP